MIEGSARPTAGADGGHPLTSASPMTLSAIHQGRRARSSRTCRGIFRTDTVFILEHTDTLAGTDRLGWRRRESNPRDVPPPYRRPSSNPVWAFAGSVAQPKPHGCAGQVGHGGHRSELERCLGAMSPRLRLRNICAARPQWERPRAKCYPVPQPIDPGRDHRSPGFDHRRRRTSGPVGYRCGPTLCSEQPERT